MKGRNNIILITVFGLCISASLTFGINLKFWEWGKEEQKSPELKPVPEKTVVAEEAPEKEAPVVKKVEKTGTKTAADARKKRKEAFGEARDNRKETMEEIRKTRKETDKEARKNRKGGKKEANRARKEVRGESKQMSEDARKEAKAKRVKAKSAEKIKKVEAKTERKLGKLGGKEPEGEEKEPVIKKTEPEDPKDPVVPEKPKKPVVVKTGKAPMPVLKRDKETEKKIQKPVFRKKAPVNEAEID